MQGTETGRPYLSDESDVIFYYTERIAWLVRVRRNWVDFYEDQPML